MGREKTRKYAHSPKFDDSYTTFPPITPTVKSFTKLDTLSAFLIVNCTRLASLLFFLSHLKLFIAHLTLYLT